MGLHIQVNLERFHGRIMNINGGFLDLLTRLLVLGLGTGCMLEVSALEFLSPRFAHFLIHSLPALLIVSGSTSQQHLSTLDKIASRASIRVTNILEVSVINPQALRSSLAFFRRLRVRMAMWLGILLNEVLGLRLEVKWSDLQRRNEVHIPPDTRNQSDYCPGAGHIAIREAD